MMLNIFFRKLLSHQREVSVMFCIGELTKWVKPLTLYVFLAQSVTMTPSPSCLISITGVDSMTDFPRVSAIFSDIC